MGLSVNEESRELSLSEDLWTLIFALRTHS